MRKMEQKLPKTLRPFLNRHVKVETFDGAMLSGQLVHVDRSHRSRGSLGNVIIRHNGGLAIMRGDAVRFIAVN